MAEPSAQGGDPSPSAASEREGSSELSDLEVALLGLLSIRPMSGYDIRRSYARALSPWWETPRTQIYPKLRTLESRGLIQHEYVVQRDKPNKRLYSLTEAGAAALTGWLTSEIRDPDLRHHMMMRLFLGNQLSDDAMRRLLVEYRDRMARRATSLREARDRFARSLSGPYRTSVFFELLSLEHLIAIADLEVTGTESVLAALDRATDVLEHPGRDQPSQLLDLIRDLFP